MGYEYCQIAGLSFLFCFLKSWQCAEQEEAFNKSSDVVLQVQFEHLCLLTFNWSIGKIEMVCVVEQNSLIQFAF